MYLLRISSKVAFIFNICFLLASALRLWPHLPQTEIGSLIVVAGYVVAIVVNAIFNVSVVILFFVNRRLLQGVARWLMLINFLFLVAEIIYFFGRD
jgi:hypothetical protein